MDQGDQGIVKGACMRCFLMELLLCIHIEGIRHSLLLENRDFLAETSATLFIFGLVFDMDTKEI